MSHLEERNHDHTIHVSGLDKSVNEALLWELMIQAGPVVSVYIPRDKLTKEHSGYGFVEFQSEADVQYAIKIMDEVPLYNKKLYINLSGRDKKTFDIGANLYIGHLDPSVDDRQLTETFQSFGNLIGPSKVIRDEVTGQSKGCGFVYYDSFDASDAAIAAMNDQFFCNKRITVTYAYKKDKPGERHGDAAERLLASKNPVLKHRKELLRLSQTYAAKTATSNPAPTASNLISDGGGSSGNTIVASTSGQAPLSEIDISSNGTNRNATNSVMNNAYPGMNSQGNGPYTQAVYTGGMPAYHPSNIQPYATYEGQNGVPMAAYQYPPHGMPHHPQYPYSNQMPYPPQYSGGH